MPEGPTIVLLREQVARFEGQKILHAEGNAKIDMSRLVGQKVTRFRSWGKHFLIELPQVAVRVHPLSTVGALPAARLRAVVDQARKYSFEFLEWRRAGVLRKHWQVHNKATCPSCNGKLVRAWLGTTNRRSFFCERCQQRYGTARKPAGAQRATKAKLPKKKA